MRVHQAGLQNPDAANLTPFPFTEAAGLTLPEILVVLAISAVLLKIALPNYDTLANDGRLTALSNEFSSAVHVARSEAVKRSDDVTVCSANAGLTGCSSSSNWEHGWIVVTDDGEILLRRNSLQDLYSMRDSGAALPRGSITFNALGFTATDRAVQVCGPNDDVGVAKAVRITRPGDIRLAGDGNGNGVLEPLLDGPDLVCP